MARLELGKFCPLIKEDCIGLKCAWYTHVRGTDPQGGQEVDEYACAVAWSPILMINMAKEAREGAAATESLRNEMVKTADTALKAQLGIVGLIHQAQPLAIGKRKET